MKTRAFLLLLGLVLLSPALVALADFWFWTISGETLTAWEWTDKRAIGVAVFGIPGSVITIVGCLE